MFTYIYITYIYIYITMTIRLAIRSMQRTIDESNGGVHEPNSPSVKGRSIYTRSPSPPGALESFSALIVANGLLLLAGDSVLYISQRRAARPLWRHVIKVANRWNERHSSPPYPTPPVKDELMFTQLLMFRWDITLSLVSR